jgi:hypothetical protein
MQNQPRPGSSAVRSRFYLVLALALTASAGTALADPGKGKGNSNGNGNGQGNGNGKGNGKAVGQAADFIPPGHRRAPVEVVVKEAPPAIRVEAMTARPSVAHIWVPGFWVWESGSYVWTKSVWILPPEPAAVWVQPRYEQRASVHIMISGYWRI